MARPIETDDIVSVHYTDGSILEAVTVIHAPYDVGDLWFFRDAGGIVYGQNPQSALFDCIVKSSINNEKAA